jgi:hypothetical protein
MIMGPKEQVALLREMSLAKIVEEAQLLEENLPPDYSAWTSVNTPEYRHTYSGDAVTQVYHPMRYDGCLTAVDWSVDLESDGTPSGRILAQVENRTRVTACYTCNLLRDSHLYRVVIRDIETALEDQRPRLEKIIADAEAKAKIKANEDRWLECLRKAGVGELEGTSYGVKSEEVTVFISLPTADMTDEEITSLLTHLNAAGVLFNDGES